MVVECTPPRLKSGGIWVVWYWEGGRGGWNFIGIDFQFSSGTWSAAVIKSRRNYPINEYSTFLVDIPLLKLMFILLDALFFDVAVTLSPLSLSLPSLSHSVVLMEGSPATCRVALMLMSSLSARSAGGVTYAPRASLVACNTSTWGTSRFRSAPRTCIDCWSLFARPPGRSWRNYFTMDTATPSGSSDKKV